MAICHNYLDITEIVRQVLEEGRETAPEEPAHISPYPTGCINRFGEWSTHEFGIQLDAYVPKLNADFAPLRGQDLPPPTSARPPDLAVAGC